MVRHEGLPQQGQSTPVLREEAQGIMSPNYFC